MNLINRNNMKIEEEIISKVFDRSVEALGLMTKRICDAIEGMGNPNIQYVEYRGMKCQLIGTSDGATTLNTGGLAFCIALPDGTINNVQDSSCKIIRE